MKVRISSAAYRDLDRGRQFYANQSRPVGLYFLNSLFTDIDSLHRHAGIHVQIRGYHRLLAKRFPYAIYLEEASRCLQSIGPRPLSFA